MRQTKIAFSCQVVLVLVAVAIWLVGKRGGPSEVADPREPPTPTVTDPAVHRLPVYVAYFGDDEFGPCYVDHEKQILHRWKGVVLRREQLKETPYATVPSGLRVLVAKNFTVASVEPIVSYRQEVNSTFRPGHSDPSIQAFYEWKGVALRAEELLAPRPDGTGRVLKFPEDVPQHVLEIDMPVSFKEQPALWKKR